MRQKLLLFGRTSLLLQRILIITSLLLAVLTFGNFFLKTSTIIENQTASQENAGHILVTDTAQIISTMKVIGSGGCCDDKNISHCLNNHFGSSCSCVGKRECKLV
ncbi:hypothetical protein B188_25840 [Candidatus Brocadiaceae bacterium B188]|nr:hypothetical protein [Candidatus Brocadia sapporoensis]QQR65821.1 MAG: hypothetical protein IPI25_09640 [Candidatus Brocadia sp.]RZV59679.1 MAG: hypothetical protein EX330_00435 [Candidatus Brocadia sp. BROELEC01]TWU50154.1 hypothetical protein B188_25840 [Candidatus Brocadiaceae bacterium B188]